MAVKKRRFSAHARAAPAPGKGLPRWVRHAARTMLHLLTDGGAVTLAFFGAYALRFSEPVASVFAIEGIDPGFSYYRPVLYVLVPLWLGIFWYVSKIYKNWITPFDLFLRIIQGSVLGVALTLAATFLFDRLAYSRLMLLLVCPLAVFAVSLAHVLVARIDAFLAEFESVSPMLLVGKSMVSEIIRENIHGRHPNVPIHEIGDLPSPEELSGWIVEKGVTEVVLVKRKVDHTELLALAEACESAGVNFRMIPDLLELRLGEIQMDESLGLPAYRLQHLQLTRANFAAKRAFDLAFSLAVFAVFGIPLAAIALLIRLDSKGPALFKQKRIGLRGTHFDAYKFRTMCLDAEAKLSSVRGKNAQTGGFFKAKADPRVTRVGRWLRRFSLDEFPQFINVLKGEMSVVGPRPLAVSTGELAELVSEFGPTARKRTNALPGITGLWQVSGRSDISAEQRFALDMFYIEHWSLGLDLEIILKTVPAMLSARGAY